MAFDLGRYISRARTSYTIQRYVLLQIIMCSTFCLVSSFKFNFLVSSFYLLYMNMFQYLQCTKIRFVLFPFNIYLTSDILHSKNERTIFGSKVVLSPLEVPKKPKRFQNEKQDQKRLQSDSEPFLVQ